MVGEAEAGALGHASGKLVVEHVVVHLPREVVLTGQRAFDDGIPHGVQHDLYEERLKLEGLLVEFARFVDGAGSAGVRRLAARAGVPIGLGGILDREGADEVAGKPGIGEGATLRDDLQRFRVTRPTTRTARGPT